jgi:putative flippase GtrA
VRTSQTDPIRIQAPLIPKLLHELLGYGLVSALALAVDRSVLGALVKLGGWHYLPACALAFIAGGAIAYVLSVRFVFHPYRGEPRPVELGYFVALGAARLLVNAGALSLAIGKAGLDLFTAKLFAAGCSFAANFALRRRLLFTP